MRFFLQEIHHISLQLVLMKVYFAWQEEARKIDAEVAERGLPPSCIPTYCMDGGKPPDPRPAFDHFSTYEVTFS